MDRIERQGISELQNDFFFQLWSKIERCMNQEMAKKIREADEKEGDKRLINLFPSPLSSHFKLSDYVTWVSELQLLQY